MEVLELHSAELLLVLQFDDFLDVLCWISGYNHQDYHCHRQNQCETMSVEFVKSLLRLCSERTARHVAGI